MMQILLVGMQGDISGPFQRLEWSPGDADETLARASCIMLTARSFSPVLLSLSSCGFHFPSDGATPCLFDHFPWKSLGCGY